MELQHIGLKTKNNECVKTTRMGERLLRRGKTNPNKSTTKKISNKQINDRRFPDNPNKNSETSLDYATKNISVSIYQKTSQSNASAANIDEVKDEQKRILLKRNKLFRRRRQFSSFDPSLVSPIAPVLEGEYSIAKLNKIILHPQITCSPIHKIEIADANSRKQRYMIMKGKLEPNSDLVLQHQHLFGFRAPYEKPEIDLATGRKRKPYTVHDKLRIKRQWSNNINEAWSRMLNRDIEERDRLSNLPSVVRALGSLWQVIDKSYGRHMLTQKEYITFFNQLNMMLHGKFMSKEHKKLLLHQETWMHLQSRSKQVTSKIKTVKYIGPTVFKQSLMTVVHVWSSYRIEAKYIQFLETITGIYTELPNTNNVGNSRTIIGFGRGFTITKDNDNDNDTSRKSRTNHNAKKNKSKLRTRSKSMRYILNSPQQYTDVVIASSSTGTATITRRRPSTSYKSSILREFTDSSGCHKDFLLSTLTTRSTSHSSNNNNNNEHHILDNNASKLHHASAPVLFTSRKTTFEGGKAINYIFGPPRTEGDNDDYNNIIMDQRRKRYEKKNSRNQTNNNNNNDNNNNRMIMNEVPGPGAYNVPPAVPSMNVLTHIYRPKSKRGGHKKSQKKNSGRNNRSWKNSNTLMLSDEEIDYSDNQNLPKWLDDASYRAHVAHSIRGGINTGLVINYESYDRTTTINTSTSKPKDKHQPTVKSNTRDTTDNKHQKTSHTGTNKGNNNYNNGATINQTANTTTAKWVKAHQKNIKVLSEKKLQKEYLSTSRINLNELISPFPTRPNKIAMKESNNKNNKGFAPFEDMKSLYKFLESQSQSQSQSESYDTNKITPTDPNDIAGGNDSVINGGIHCNVAGNSTWSVGSRVSSSKNTLRLRRRDRFNLN